MRLDVVDLKRFYDSPLGAAASAMILRRITALWPHAKAMDVVGVGYAAPYLHPYLAGARRVALAMPGEQGAEAWPPGAPAAACLTEESALPFRDAVFDRALLVHALEESDALGPLLDETWRVCAGQARVIVVAPSRASLWSLSDASPFGHGRPFSRSQLARLLRRHGFEPTAWAQALYAPPLRWGAIARSMEGWEFMGEWLWPGFGGVILAEAKKQALVDPGGKAVHVFSRVSPVRAQPAYRS
jgi:SAM-dependent methyltransferase